MREERRTGNQEINEELLGYLSHQQLSTLNRMERFGWNLKFVRHALFQDVTVVISNEETQDIAVIEGDGAFNKDHGLFLRH